MKPLLSSSSPGRGILLLALAAPVLAQRGGDLPTTVQISAPQNFVVAARGLQLTARQVNGRGALLRGRSLDWSVSDAARASIDASGMLSGISPGSVDVTAIDHDSGVSGSLHLYVYPSSISMTPKSTTVDAGDTLKLSADALDADGKVIPNVPLQWSSDRPDVARITADGTLTGVSEGRVTVAAGLDMGPAFARFSAFTSVEVMRRADFRLRTLISTDTVSKGVTTLAIGRFAAAGNFAASIASLSNGGQAVLLSQNGRSQTLALTGVALGGRPITRFDSLTVNSVGDVAVLANAQAEWCEQLLVLFPASAKWAPAILDDTTRCSYWSLPPAAIDKQGGIAYRYASGLYYRKPDGTRQTILSQGDQAPGVNSVSNIPNWSVTAFGKVLLEAVNQAGVSVLLAWDGTRFQKLFTVGDFIGNDVSQWARLPVEVAADVYLSRIGGAAWSSIARLSGGKWTLVARNGQKDINWVQDYCDQADGNIFFMADTTGGTALWRTDGITLTKLTTFPTWRDVSGLVAIGGDTVLAYGLLGGPVPHAVRFQGGASTELAGPSTPVEGNSSPAIGQASIPKGVNLSGIVLRTFGDTLLRITSSGSSVLLKPGDPLPSGTLGSLNSMAGNRLGEVAFTAQHGNKTGLYTWRAGQFQLLADTDDRFTDNSQIYGFSSGDNQLAMNNQGHVAAWTFSSGYNALVLFSNGTYTARSVIRQGGSAPGGGAFNGFNQVAIDDTDRVAFIANLSNGKTGVYLWEQGSVRTLVESGQADPAGRALQSFNSLQAAGNRFYLRAYSSVNEYLVLDGASVKLVAAEGYLTSFGTLLSGVFGAEVTANSRGDVAMPVLTPAGPALFVKRADGTDALVAISSRRGPDSEWFLGIYGAGIGEQGEIVLSALGWIDGHLRLAIYQATPNVP